MEKEDNKAVDLSSLGSFDFTPAWARKEEHVSVGKVSNSRETSPGRVRPPAERKTSERKAFERKPFDRKPFERRESRPAERQRPLDIVVKILPETKALGTIIRKLQQDSHAYKLKELAYFFLDNPNSVLLKITPKPAANGAAVKPLSFHQCKACSFASTDEADVVAHIVAAHLGDYYDAREIDCEPPKGNFNCVARCGLSGVLLGPPNIHGFNATVREMIRTRYPSMSEEQYRSRIEMVRDPAVIDEWRKSAVKKTVFVAKGAGEDAPQLTREQAEAEFKRTMLPSMLEVPKHLMITADVALKSPFKPLQWAVKDALDAEKRSPSEMCFALRGAFHHRKMHFFRVNDAKGPEFVTGVELKQFDSAHAIAELAAIADFIAANPCSTKAEIAKDAEAEKQLAWLVSTGHVVAYTNGVFSQVEKFPKYGPQWRKKGKKVEVDKVEVEVKAEEVEVKNEDTGKLAE